MNEPMDPATTLEMHRLEIPDLQLDPDRIIETIGALSERIQERFPGSGLGKLAGRLHSIAETTVGRLEGVTRPNLPIRFVSGLLILLFVSIIAGLIWFASYQPGIPDFFELIQTLEAGSNELIFIGVAVFFLVTLEFRIRRRKALSWLRELRAIAHIVDMHQLTQDPDKLEEKRGEQAARERQMQRSRLTRYLDYCSEMLSLVSKIAALYAQTFHDPVVLAAVDEVESLTTGLSSKIWQKIIILDRMTTGNTES